MMVFKGGASLNYKFENRNLLATGYYMSTTGINALTLQKHAKEYDKQYQIEESLNKKEYASPFKSSYCQDLNKVKASA